MRYASSGHFVLASAYSPRREELLRRIPCWHGRRLRRPDGCFLVALRAALHVLQGFVLASFRGSSDAVSAAFHLGIVRGPAVHDVEPRVDDLHSSSLQCPVREEGGHRVGDRAGEGAGGEIHSLGGLSTSLK